MSFSVDVSTHQGGAERIVLSGRLDSNTAPDFEQAAEAVIASPPGTVILDLGALEYISSAGLRTLFRAQKSMKARAGKVLMLNPQPPVQKVFDIVKAADVQQVFRNVAELDAYLDAMQKQVRE